MCQSQAARQAAALITHAQSTASAYAMAPAVTHTIDGKEYISKLASFIRRNESKLADFVRRKPAATAPSWGTILTLGIMAGEVPVDRPPLLILRFDPHHLYFLLLKFDEAGIPGIGSLDVRIDGGASRPMSVNCGNNGLPILGGGGMLGLPDSDNMSFRSNLSSFSMGSGWWGTSAPPPDETVDVKYLYSSCTKLPALRLNPFTYSSVAPSRSSSSTHALSKPVQDFEDCPPPDTTVPLYAFKNLQSLILEDLDPRAFLGWDALSMHLRSLEIHQSGIEDLGELICDAVVEDLERRKKGSGLVGEERRRRQGTSVGMESEHGHAHAPQFSVGDDTATADVSAELSSYPKPPTYAWSQLRHLSLANNSLTFVPSPPLSFLSVLTSLDLSSNLLIAVPPGLAQLHSLRSLNLADNMIDTLVGVHKLLGAVTVINLSKNRLEGLSGLDRLFALERVDVRSNRIHEALEISRLAQLPCLRGVWLEGNPFTAPVAQGGEEGFRVKCFSYFSKEHRGDVTLDGSLPSMTERRAVESEVGRRHDRTRRASVGGTARGGVGSEEARTSSEAKVVGRRVVTAPESRAHDRSPSPPPTLPTIDLSLATAASSPNSATPKVKHRHRKPHRIVDLDGASAPAPSSSGARSTAGGDLSEPSGVSDTSDLSSSGREVPPDQSGLRREHTASQNKTSSAPATRRVQGTSSLGPSSSDVKASRRDRLSASTFEPPAASISTSGDEAGGSSSGPESSGAAFRKRIEALRSEVGESWLSVLGERELAAERKAALSEESDAGAKAKAKAEAEAGAEVGRAATAVAVTQEEAGQQTPEVSPNPPAPAAEVKVVKKRHKKRGRGGKK